MAEINITPFGLSDNDIADLSAILSHELCAYQQKSFVFAGDYWLWLNTTVGLGYAAVLAEGCAAAECIYRNCLNRYLAVRANSLRAFKSSDAELASQLVSQMIKEAMAAFYALRFPRYFQHFAEALKQTICHAGLHGNSDLDKTADRLMRIIDYHSAKR